VLPITHALPDLLSPDKRLIPAEVELEPFAAHWLAL
jgi:hypothetical protein